MDLIAIGAGIAAITGVGAGTVSYTHLDVYKRQLRSQRDGENGSNLRQYSPVLLYGNRDIR